jgi:photosystem II stability/assembly factor-like uncharacterized protein
MNTRERAGSFLRWVLWGTLVGALISGCGSKGEAVPVAPVDTERYAGSPSAGSSGPSAAAVVSPVSSGLGVSIAPQVTPSSSPSGLPQATAGESGEELWFGIDRMEFVNEKVGWVAGENTSGPFLGRTSTGGADWAKEGTNGMYLTALAPMERDRGFAVGNTDCEVQTGSLRCLSKGIYETTDGGAHWTPRWQTETSREEGNPYTAEILSVSPTGWGYAVAAHRLLLTRDGGASWEAAAFTGRLEGFVPEKAVFTSQLQGWAAGFMVTPGCAGSAKPAEADDGCRIPAVAYTDNGGSAWRLDELPEAERGEIVISISAMGGNRASVLLFNRDNLEASFYSGTAGASGDWQQVSQFRGGRPYATDMHFLSADRGFVALTPGAGPIEGGLLTTADGGKKWDMAPIENIYGVKRISFPDTRAGWLLGEGNGERHTLLRTRNAGESWERVPLPLEVFGR